MKGYSQPTPEQTSAAEPANRSLDFLGDVKLSCSVVFGVCSMSIRQLLSLAPGSVLELSGNEGESLEFRANGKTVARGEVVGVNDHYGIRITEVVEARDTSDTRTK